MKVLLWVREGMGVTPSWLAVDANSSIRGRVRATEKAPERNDRQTDRQRDTRSVHYMMMIIIIVIFSLPISAFNVAGWVTGIKSGL